MYKINQVPIRAALDKFGPTFQVDILIEEMAELTKAIIKARRAGNGYRTRSVVDEIADVRICLESLTLVLDDEGETSLAGIAPMVQAKIDEKLLRLDQMVLGLC